MGIDIGHFAHLLKLFQGPRARIIHSSHRVVVLKVVSLKLTVASSPWHLSSFDFSELVWIAERRDRVALRYGFWKIVCFKTIFHYEWAITD